MRPSYIVLVGLGLLSTAQAQTSPAGVELTPIPKQLPSILFYPGPLSGDGLQGLTPLPPGTALQASPPTSGTVAQNTVAQAGTDAGAAPGTSAPAATDNVPATDPAAPLATGATPAAGAAPADPAAPPAAEPAAAEAGPEPAPSAPAPGTTITVIVENVLTASGSVNIGVCDTGLSEDGCPHGAQVAAAATGFVSTTFRDIPPGRYAVVGYHDANANGEFDKFLGIPREPYALSGKAAEMLAPGFDDAALTIKEGPNTVIIRLQNLFEE